MFQHHYDYIVCKKCGQEFKLDTVTYPSKVDEDRNTSYECPYCNDSTEIYVRGYDDVFTFKIK